MRLQSVLGRCHLGHGDKKRRDVMGLFVRSPTRNERDKVLFSKCAVTSRVRELVNCQSVNVTSGGVLEFCYF